MAPAPLVILQLFPSTSAGAPALSGPARYPLFRGVPLPRSASTFAREPSRGARLRTALGAHVVTLDGPPRRYSFGFLGASLRPDLARVVAEIFVEEGSWEATRARVLATNALQCRTRQTLRRMEQELRLRLSTLTPVQVQILVSAAGPDRVAMVWLATLKQSTFLFDFAAEVLREKLVGTDRVLRYSDYESFLDTHTLTHPEIGNLKPSTRAKLRQMLMHMLTEAALIHGGRKAVLVQRPPMGSAVLTAIVADDARWLAGFLYTDDEVETLRCR